MTKRQVVLLILLLILGVGLIFTWVIRTGKSEIEAWQTEAKYYQLINRELKTAQYYNWLLEGVNLPDAEIHHRRDSTVFYSSVKLRKKGLLVYIDYRMCNPCIESSLELIQALIDRYGDKIVVLVYTPGREIGLGIDFSSIDSVLYTTSKPLIMEDIRFETPCYLLVENSTVRHAYYSLKNVNPAYEFFKQLIDRFLN